MITPCTQNLPVRPKDVWEYQIEHSIDVDNEHIHLKIPGSETLSTCTLCSGHKMTDCDYCLGKGKIQCDDCKDGKYSCVICLGRGGTICRTCGDNPEWKNRCPQCKGNGRIKCLHCKDGVVQCQKCLGKVITICTACDGFKQLVCIGCNGIGKVEQYLQVKSKQLIETDSYEDWSINTDAAVKKEFKYITGTQINVITHIKVYDAISDILSELDEIETRFKIASMVTSHKQKIESQLSDNAKLTSIMLKRTDKVELLHFYYTYGNVPYEVIVVKDMFKEHFCNTNPWDDNIPPRNFIQKLLGI